ncbi:MAG: hypothetical protein QW500_01365 [Candidatus Micrarchaeia archaeon]
MRVPFFILALLFALSPCFAFNATYLDPTIEKPWEFNSVSLPDFITNVLLNSPGRTDIDNSYMFALSPEVSSQLSEEIRHAKNADQNLKTLGESRYLLKDAIQSHLNETVGKSAAAIAYMLVPMLGMFLAIDAGTGAIYEVSDLGAEMLSICKNHYTAAVAAVEESELAYNGLLSKVSIGYRELWLMGALNPSYKGRYANDIAQLESRLASIDGKLLREREASIKKYARMTANDPSAYHPLVSESVFQARYLLDGQESAFSKLIFAYTAQNSIKEGLIKERESAKSSAETRAGQISAEYSEVSKKYGQITDADVVYFGIATLDTLDSPSTHISKASENIAEYTSIISEGDRVYAAKSYGYVIDSINAYYLALSKMDSASYNLKEAARRGILIVSSAENITQKEYIAATAAASAFIPKTAAEQQQLSLARSMIEKAEKEMALASNTPAERISHLKIALNSLRLARAYLSPDEVFRANAKDSAVSSLDYLKSVIDRAKTDSIDVSYEESYYKSKMLALQSGNLAAAEMVNISLTCNNLTEQIFMRGAAQYSHLSSRYATLLPLATYFESLDGKPLKEYTLLNPYIDATGTFDKYLSLGHYKEITGLIAGLEAQIRVKTKELIRESLERNAVVSVNYDNATIVLDVPITRKVDVSTYSILDLEYKGPISTSIRIPYDVSRSKAKYDTAGLSYSYTNNQLNILINQYTPNKMYTISFEDTQVLARTQSVKRESTLITPTLLRVKVERKITSLGTPYLKIPANYDYSYVLYYDGEYVGSFNYDAEIARPIPAGEHILTMVYSIENPFVATLNSVSSTKTSTTMSVIIKNTVPFDISDAMISYDIPAVSPSSVLVSSSDCEIKSTASTHFPTYTRLTINVKAFSASSKCTFDIHASTPISKEYIEEEIVRLSKDNTALQSKEVENHLNKARNAFETGKYEDALKAISDADKTLVEAKRATEQANRQGEEIERLSKQTASVLANLSNMNDVEVQKALAKIKSYYDSANAEAEPAKKLTFLRKANDEVLALNTLVYSKISSISERLNSVKQKWLLLIDKGYSKSMPPEVAEVESVLAMASSSPNPDSSTFLQLGKASSILDLLEISVKNADKNASEWESSLKERFKSSVTMLKAAIAQLTKACGTKCPQDMVSYSQSLLSLNPQTPSEYSISIDTINKTLSSINTYISTERSAANTAISELKSISLTISDPRVKQVLTPKIQEIESMYVAGEYSRAKEAAIAVKESLTGTPQKPAGDYTLILAGLAVIAISFIILKMRERGAKSNEAIQEAKQLKREK